jgi:hypothetical protein
MQRHFVRTIFMGFLIALLAFGGINMASATKPTPPRLPGQPQHQSLLHPCRSSAPGIAAITTVIGVSSEI